MYMDVCVYTLIEKMTPFIFKELNGLRYIKTLYSFKQNNEQLTSAWERRTKSVQEEEGMRCVGSKSNGSHEFTNKIKNNSPMYF